MDKALLGWGDLVVKGPNEMFTGTLGETPQPNGIGGGTARPAIRTNSIRERERDFYIQSEGRRRAHFGW